MIIVSILLHAEFGQNHLESAPNFKIAYGLIFWANILKMWRKPIYDFEDFLVNIKCRKVKNQAFIWNQQVYSFHLSLLTHHERKKLEMGDESFLSTFTRLYSKRKGCFDSPDVSKEEMETSESKQKYALSTCSRCTFVLSVHLRQSDEITEDDSSDESLSEQLQFGYDWVFSE